MWLLGRKTNNHYYSDHRTNVEVKTKRDSLVSQYIGLAFTIATQYTPYCLDKDSVYSEASIALLKTIDLYLDDQLDGALPSRIVYNVHVAASNVAKESSRLKAKALQLDPLLSDPDHEELSRLSFTEDNIRYKDWLSIQPSQMARRILELMFKQYKDYEIIVELNLRREDYYILKEAIIERIFRYENS